MADEGRPQCGGGNVNEDDYDLPLHVAAVCKLLAQSFP